MKKQEVRALVERVGIVPVIRAASAEEARFAAEAVRKGGVPILEITMTVPGAVEVIRELAKTMTDVVVGAGTVLNEAAARECAAAGAQFFVTPGFNEPTVAFAKQNDLLMVAGALTPSEIMEATAAGADFVKVFPCGSMGGPKYIQALRGPFPKVPFVPTGGVNLETAGDYIRAGAAALGVGGEMVLKDALKARDADAISKTAALFVDLIRDARAGLANAK